jgi:ribonuclease HI
MHLIVFTDGGSRGNPGPAAIGASIADVDGNELDTISEYIGETTNNVAEYTAVVKALEVARDMGANQVTLKSDSELLIRQLEGRYKVKAVHLQPLFRAARDLLNGFASANIEHVRREGNVRADELVNIALDARASGAL